MEGIGKRIKSLRALHGMKQEDLALKLGVSISTICGWEKDTYEPSLKNMKMLCDLFHITPNRLLGIGNQELVFLDEKDRTMLSTYRDIMPEKLKDVMRSIAVYTYDQHMEKEKVRGFVQKVHHFISRYGLSKLWEAYEHEETTDESLNRSLYLRHDIKVMLENLMKENYSIDSSEITGQELYEVGCDMDAIENKSSMIFDFHFHE